MRTVRIVADDLTGALDAASPFAAVDGPMPVFWDPGQVYGVPGSLALDLESRDAPGSVPHADWVGVLADADVAFKKLDSLLRGRPAEELATCLASGRFASVVIAPAFPAQQRITAGGRQHWRSDPGAPWRMVPCDLAAGLRTLGHEARIAGSVEAMQGRGVVVADAASEADLAAIVEAASRLEAPVLFAGTAGLAHALAGKASQTVSPPRPPLLFIVGSIHPVTVAQVLVLEGRHPDVLVRIRSGAKSQIDAAVVRLGERLESGAFAALVFELPDGTAQAAAGDAISGTLAALVEAMPRPRSLVVTGGDTLIRLMRAAGTRSLLVQGELLPGVPASIVEGGPFAGATLISKSGAFGRADILVYLAGLLEAGEHG